MIAIAMLLKNITTEAWERKLPESLCEQNEPSNVLPFTNKVQS